MRSQNFILNSNLSSIGIYKHLQYVSQTIGIVFLITICFLFKYKFFNKLQLFILILITNVYLVFSTSISGLIYTVVLSLLIIFGIFQKTLKNNIIYIYMLIPFILISVLRFNLINNHLIWLRLRILKLLIFLLFERFNSMVYFIKEISSINDFYLAKIT